MVNVEGWLVVNICFYFFKQSIVLVACSGNWRITTYICTINLRRKDYVSAALEAGEQRPGYRYQDFIADSSSTKYFIEEHQVQGQSAFAKCSYFKIAKTLVVVLSMWDVGKYKNEMVYKGTLRVYSMLWAPHCGTVIWVASRQHIVQDYFGSCRKPMVFRLMNPSIRFCVELGMTLF